MPKILEIKTLNSSTVYKNSWMTVREDKILRADGSEGIFGVVDKPDFAVIAALEYGQVHLVQQYRYPIQERCWEFPQGSWENEPDIDPLTLAQAELKEETGLIAGTMLHVAHLKLAAGYSTQGYNIFLARELRQGPLVLARDEQDLVAKSFPIKEVKDMIVRGEIRDATTVATVGVLSLKGLFT